MVGTSGLQFEEHWKKAVCRDGGRQSVWKVYHDELRPIRIVLHSDSEKSDSRHEAGHQGDRNGENGQIAVPQQVLLQSKNWLISHILKQWNFNFEINFVSLQKTDINAKMLQ